MDWKKGNFIAAALLLSPYVFCTWSSLPAEPVEGVQAIATGALPTPGDDRTQCPEEFVDPSTEGPYYKNGSPERMDLVEEGIVGEPVELSGYVFDKNCNPVPGAWLDFWQADGNGSYDNRGYKLRGHQFTDTDGKYLSRTYQPYPCESGREIRWGSDNKPALFPGQKSECRRSYF
jgi:protocatechuate 3,4-dioxygenase beta subunit